MAYRQTLHNISILRHTSLKGATSSSLSAEPTPAKNFTIGTSVASEKASFGFGRSSISGGNLRNILHARLICIFSILVRDFVVCLHIHFSAYA